MNSELFHKWFQKCFLPNIPNDRPALLIVDSHVSHISVDVIELAIANKVTILKLPPRSTHVLLALDVGVFRSMKNTWDKELCKWQRANPRNKLPKNKFVQLLASEYQKMSSDNIVNGLKKPGIYNQEENGPDRTQISQTMFTKPDIEKYKQQKRQAEKKTDGNYQVADVVSHTGKQPETDVEIISETQSNESTAEDHQSQTSKSLEDEQLVVSAPKQNGLKMNQIPHEDIAGPSTTRTDEIPSTNEQSFETLLLSFIKNQREPSTVDVQQKKKRRICSGAEIIT